MRTITFILALLLGTLQALFHAEASEKPDTISTRVEARELIVPAAVIAAGTTMASIPWWRTNVDKEIERGIGSTRRWSVAGYVEWLPFATLLAAEYLGAGSNAGICDRAMLAATSFVILEAVTQPVKRIAGRMRPDGSDNHSFPSGHTATAFAGAELTRMVYGNALGAGAYAVAAGVAAMRMAGRHHYLSDCVAGAGIGIMSARVAAWLLPLERRLLRLDRYRHNNLRSETSVVPAEISLIPAVSAHGATATLFLTF